MKNKLKSLFGYLQRIGKALMLPIAALPAAGLLLRIGQPDLLNIPFIAATGQAIFDNLPLIFAIGISTGLAVDGSGAAALAGAISFVVLTKGATAINKDIDMSVFAGIIAGVTAGELYNRFYKIELPEWLAFFGGKRFVPIISSFSMIIMALIMGHCWPTIQDEINNLSIIIQGMGSVGAGLYGFFNRLLIPLGLHHVLNSYFWFLLGDFTNSAGKVIHGDLHRFFALDPSAGTYMSGFFPFLMFGYPAAVLAMYTTAKKENRKKVCGMFVSIGLTAFLTGIGEPIDFIYMFIAPPLYLIHSILVGLSMAITDLLGIKLGFTFSAGAIDYILNFGIGTKAILIIPIGIVFGIIYFILFRFAILKFDIKTPGREDDFEELQEFKSESNIDSRANQIIVALGGKENILEVGACITRLRIQVKDVSYVNKKSLKSIGASGVLEVGNNIQAVFGTKAELIRDEVQQSLEGMQ